MEKQKKIIFVIIIKSKNLSLTIIDKKYLEHIKLILHTSSIA